MPDYLHPNIPDEQLHVSKGHALADVSTIESKDFNSLTRWLRYIEPVITVADVNGNPPSENDQDRYLLVGDGTADVDWDGAGRGWVVEFNAADDQWLGIEAVAADHVCDLDGTHYRYNGTVWLAEGALHSVTTDTMIDERHSIILVDASGGDVVLSLPSPVSFVRQKFYIRRTDAGVTTVTIGRNGAEEIDAVAGDKTIAASSGVIITSDGTDWWTLADV